MMCRGVSRGSCGVALDLYVKNLPAFYEPALYCKKASRAETRDACVMMFYGHTFLCCAARVTNRKTVL